MEMDDVFTAIFLAVAILVTTHLYGPTIVDTAHSILYSSQELLIYPLF